MFQLAHISDPHLAPLPAPSFAQLLGKRLIGYLSWHQRRKAFHQRRVLSALAVDLAEMRPHHVAITGDICNISLPREFVNGRDWLNTLGRPDAISVVPGNHDTYVSAPWEETLGLWAEYMSSDSVDGGEPVPARGFDDFPYVRICGPLAIIGVSSSIPAPYTKASGRVGAQQLADLEAVLAELGSRDLFRTVLIHHPPFTTGVKPRKRLEDLEGFQGVLGRAGAELVLHGHNHNFSFERIAGARGYVPVIGVPSASVASDLSICPAHYHVYDIERDQNRWRVTVRVRGLDPLTEEFTATDTYSFQTPLQ
jgi:3',5'-cyclic AMP phosphodiesterase CpdA